MLILNPPLVTFGAAKWENVVSAAIDRLPHREAVEWTDLGPHAAFVDVPEERVVVRIVQELTRDSIEAPRPRDEGSLTLHTSPTASQAGRKKVTMQAVVTRVEHGFSLTRGALRTILLTAVSSDGAADPITVTDASS